MSKQNEKIKIPMPLDDAPKGRKGIEDMLKRMSEMKDDMESYKEKSDDKETA